MTFTSTATRQRRYFNPGWTDYTRRVYYRAYE